MSLEILTHSEILAPFFFLIGLQLRNEITHIKEIALPSIAALGGMILPAIIFLSLNSDPEISNGWPLVMPTDIALVMLVLLALGKRVSIGLIGMVGLGVLVGKIPLERIFTNFVNFIILPVYVIANIYPVIIEGFELNSPVGNSIIIARLFGKVIGITIFAIIGAKLLKYPLGIKNNELISAACLAGMGLAVSLMIANLSYDSEMLLNQVTAGLLIAAVISGLVGSLILLITQRSNAK